MLPIPKRLVENGYGGLTQAIRHHPELFKHIKQDSKKGHSPQEWVPIAERLARKHGGTLPCPGWLQKNSHGVLQQVIRHHPELFKHIKQKRLR
jgi:hypothetical protein